jgi:hypothetical protein
VDPDLSKDRLDHKKGVPEKTAWQEKDHTDSVVERWVEGEWVETWEAQ